MVDETKPETTQVKLDLSSEPSLLEQTRKVVEELKAQNDRKEQLLIREEKMKANELLGGKADAGQAPVVKEETPQEYLARIMKGKI